MLNKLNSFLKTIPTDTPNLTNNSIFNIPKQEPVSVSVDRRVLDVFEHLSIENTDQEEDNSINPIPEPYDLGQLFVDQQHISIKVALDIINKAMELFMKEDNLLTLTAPILICGDVHGQFYDLMEIFRNHGNPRDECKYLFLGDYVDRGSFSCEILLLLLSYKIKYPKQVFLLRGNHETHAVSSFYGFKEECELKYGSVVYNRCIALFQCLPLASLLSTNYGDFLALHGGLSPDIKSLEDIQQLNRYTEPQETGPLCDLLWSDPAHDIQENDWTPNQARGCSYQFSASVAKNFLRDNKLLCLIRAHQLVDGGFHSHFNTEEEGHENEKTIFIPTVLTVFSAPNYCNSYGNKGATLFLGMEKESFHLEQYTSSPAPQCILVESKKKQMQLYLETVIPFMPSNYREFVDAAKEIGAAIFIGKEKHLEPENNNTFKSVGNVASKIALIQKMLIKASSKCAQYPNENIVKISRRASIDRLNSGESGRIPVAELRRQWEVDKKEIETKPIKFEVHCCSFTKEELKGLKLLYELLDRRGRKCIMSDDLIAYARDSDDFAVASELALLMEALDADQSGGIEYGDILQFAIRVKTSNFKRMKQIQIVKPEIKE